MASLSGTNSFQEFDSMADNLVLDRKQTVPVPVRPQTLPMDEAIQQIRDDSQQDPEAFLDETVVPFGGE